MRPADTIRVVEFVDFVTGLRTREVIGELSRAEVGRLQLALAEAGFAPDGEWGVLDPGTREALARFQIQRGLVTCGCPSYETIVALGIRPRVTLRRVATRHQGRAPAVVVGHSPAVFVGHLPARGAGRRFEPEGRERVGGIIARPRGPGASLTPGARPRPRSPSQ